MLTQLSLSELEDVMGWSPLQQARHLFQMSPWDGGALGSIVSVVLRTKVSVVLGTKDSQ